MDFNFTEEQLALEDTISRFINKDYAFEARRKRVASEEAYDRNAWNTYAELGILALPFHEDLGGLNGTPLDTYLVMKALAPGLILEPYVSTVVLSGGLINALGTAEQKKHSLPELPTALSPMPLAITNPTSVTWKNGVHQRHKIGQRLGT